jgi:hypothetical protein
VPDDSSLCEARDDDHSWAAPAPLLATARERVRANLEGTRGLARNLGSWRSQPMDELRLIPRGTLRRSQGGVGNYATIPLARSRPLRIRELTHPTES